MKSLIEQDLKYILSNTKDLWGELKNKRIFITGGTGFIGRWLLESFVWANEKLKLNATAVVLTRNPDRFRKKAAQLVSNKAIKLLKGDIRSFVFPKGKFDFIIHAAAENRFTPDALERYESNVLGTRRVLDFARKCGAKKFLYTSSGAVQNTEINFVYGQSKRISEFFCVHYAQKFGIKIKIARCFAFVGPYLPLNINYAAGNFVRDALAGKPIKVKTNNRVYRSYLYAADLTIWLWNILFKGQSCRPYNVGSAKSLTVLDLAKKVKRVLKVRSKIIIEKKVAHPEIQRYVPNISRAEKELGLKQRIGLDEGIRRMADFYKKERDGIS